MKIALSFLLAATLVCTAAPSAYGEPRQVMQGTQVHLTLLNGISSTVTRDGDPFVAMIAEPVYLGSQLLLPAGTRVNGTISTGREGPPLFRVSRPGLHESDVPLHRSR